MQSRLCCSSIFSATAEYRFWMKNQILEYYRTNKETHLEELKEFLSIPSISSEESHRQDVKKAALFIQQQLECLDFKNVQILPGEIKDHPLVIGELIVSSDAPTVLLYAHFDVQPVTPIEEWHHDPFKPEVKGNKLYARGAVDDKGQLWILLKAVEGYVKTGSKMPVNIKVLFEGDEESSGSHIERYVKSKPSYLTDVTSAVVLDTGMFAPGIPTIINGLRGIVAAEISVRTLNVDLHSGLYGGAAPNAIDALSEILTRVKSADGIIQIPGFYDRVNNPDIEELKIWDSLPFDEKIYLKEMGAKESTGDKNQSILCRTWARPTFEVNGMEGGYYNDGFKTIVPARATAKVSMRLVPDMSPEDVSKSLIEFVEEITPAYASSTVKVFGTSPPALFDTHAPELDAARIALTETFNSEAVFVRRGGSIPITSHLKEALDIPIIITGFSLPDSNVHAPDENIEIENFFKGIEAMGRFYHYLGTPK